MANSKDKKQKPERAAHLARHAFKPGQSGNPTGRPVNPLRKALRKFTIKEYRKAIELAVQGDIEKLERIAMSKTHSVLRVGVARALLKAVRKGDWETFEAIAARIVGKIPDHLVLEGDPAKPVGHAPMGPAEIAAAVAAQMKKMKDEY